MIAYRQTADEVIESLSSNKKDGLSSEEVAARQKEYGPNKLAEKKGKTPFQRFLDQFKDVTIIILLIAAAISFVLVVVEKNWGDIFEPILILIIVIVNAIMGVTQEGKAEAALQALKNMSAPHAKVIRDGKEQIIEASELVPGDIILLEAGDNVPADSRLISSSALKSDESALTGESVPAEKEWDAEVDENAGLGDRLNMVYSGCNIAYGSAKAVVVNTGMNTEMGKIANLLDSEEEGDTPLQESLDQVGKILAGICIACCVVIFVVGLLDGMEILEVLMVAISLAVAAIPEGLPAITTIVLSIGTQRMAERNAIIRKLPSVETLGSTSVICSDKTGTLTQNRMTLTKVYVDGEADLEEVSTENSEIAKKLLAYGTLCCDGSVSFNADGTVTHVGDPTETAIVYAAHRNNMPKSELNKDYPRLGELPFDSDRKCMTTINKIDGKYIAIVKGGFDVLASRCVKGDIEKANEFVEKMSAEALRVLCVAYKELDEIPDVLTSEELENNLTFMGLVGMIDPPRPEAKEAVRLCHQAGIRTIMITGDHITTASAIAKEIGILRRGDKAITGNQLDHMTDGEFDEVIQDISVYARVSPENKIRIVKAWQRKNQVVAMTGDGVNDAPALKAADIGVAMGVTGTDVAKGAADMTLSDDNFATIVDAVKEGRGIYANIRKVICYLLGTNIGEILTVFLAMLISGETPLLSMQLLWINLVTDSLPAIALGREDVEDDVMERNPRPKDEGIFANGMFVRMIIAGVIFGAITLAGYYYGVHVSGCAEGGQTMAFMVLAFAEIVQAYNMRTNHSLFKVGPFGNSNLNKSCLICVGLTAVVAFTPLRSIFGLIVLEPQEYLFALAMCLVPLIYTEIDKQIGVIKYFDKKEQERK